jgi:hypothetical protein
MNIRKIAIILSLAVVLVAGTVLSAGAETPMSPSGFQVSYALGHAKASLRVLDALNRPVAGANVQISFEKEGSPAILRWHLTNTSGFASISAALGRGNWTVCVEEIQKRGYDYSPATNLCTSIVVH